MGLWRWGFSYDQDPVHSYTAAGTYTVSLSITDVFGAQNSMQMDVYVRPLPMALFDDNSPTCSNLPVSFTDMSTTLYGYIEQWDWDFGDGNTQTITAPAPANTSHTFPSTGIYLVTLSVTTNEGCEHSFSKTVETTPIPGANFYFASQCQGDVTNFSDQSAANGSGVINYWSWDFGDPLSGTANTSPLQNPAHQFSSAGTYGVQLIISSSGAAQIPLPSRWISSHLRRLTFPGARYALMS